MQPRVYKCVRCRLRLPAPSPDHLCDDCREIAPRRGGIVDLTSLKYKVVKPKPFVDEDGRVIKGELPMRPLWDRSAPNQWAIDGMDEHSLRRNKLLSRMTRA